MKMDRKGSIKACVGMILILMLNSFANFSFGEEKCVFFSQTAPPNMSLQLRSKDIDGFIAWEPFNAHAVLGGHGKYLVQSGDVWKGHPCCVLAVSEKMKDEDVLRALAWAHVKATKFINDSRTTAKAYDYAREFTGKELRVVEEAFRHVKFTNFPSTREMTEYYKGLRTGGLIKKTPADLGFADEEAFFTYFLDPQYVREAEEALRRDSMWKPHAVPLGTAVRMGFLIQDIHHLAMFVAQKEGYYEEVGLVPEQNLKFSQFLNGVSVMEAFKIGDIDIAYLGGAPATLKRCNDDIKVRVIAGANDEGSALVVSKNSSISEPRDLHGKTIAIPGTGTVQYFILKRLADSLGYRLTLK